MKKLLNAIFLVSGTAIGAGLIALPLTAVNLGMTVTTFIIALMIFIAYQSSMMTIDLIEHHKKSVSIVKISKEIGGKRSFTISLLSFYTLSFSLLTVYFAGSADSLAAFSDSDLCAAAFRDFRVGNASIFEIKFNARRTFNGSDSCFDDKSAHR